MKLLKQNTSKLRNTSHTENLVHEMDNALCQSSKDNNKTPCWSSFQQAVYETAKASRGKHDKKHQDWFDPNDQMLRDLMAKWDQSHQRVLQIRSTMDEMVRAIMGLKDGKALGGDGIPAEVCKYGESFCLTDCTDGSSKYGRKAMYHKPGKMPTWSPSTKKEAEQNVVITEVYIFFPQPARSLLDSVEQTLKSHHPRGGAKDAVRLLFKP